MTKPNFSVDLYSRDKEVVIEGPATIRLALNYDDVDHDLVDAIIEPLLGILNSEDFAMEIEYAKRVAKTRRKAREKAEELDTILAEANKELDTAKALLKGEIPLGK